MANNQNTMRDMKRSILKAVRDSQKTKQDAMDEYVAARVNIKSLEERLEEAREKATLLRRKAKDAGKHQHRTENGGRPHRRAVDGDGRRVGGRRVARKRGSGNREPRAGASGHGRKHARRHAG